MNEGNPTSVVIDAPAKLNLGLDILGRRDDGYHELATIFLTVSLLDRLTVSSADRMELTCDEPGIAGEDNLIVRALAAMQPLASGKSLSVALRKRIPLAAGLGGASSDAAATLLAARDVWQLTCSHNELAAIGRILGSDVPFFLRGGCAVGRGRGELLEVLPLLSNVWFVVVVPKVSIPHKTATLYAHLAPRDFGDGSSVEAQAARLRTGRPLDNESMPNAFARPLYEIAPDLLNVPQVMRQAGAPSVAVSGAGPAHYTMVDDPALAGSIASKLRGSLGTAARVFVVAPAPARPIDF